MCSQTDCVAHLCDLETAQLLASLKCKGSVRGCDMTEQLVYVTSLDGYVRLWDKRARPDECSALKMPSTCHGIRRAVDDGTVFVSTG